MGEDASPDVRKRPKKELDLIDGLTTMYFSLGLFVGQIDPIDGELIIAGTAGGQQVTSDAKQRAESLVDLGRAHPEFMRFLQRLTAGSAYTAVIGSHLALVLAIMSNHGVNPIGSIMMRMKERATRSQIKKFAETNQPAPVYAPPQNQQHEVYRPVEETPTIQPDHVPSYQAPIIQEQSSEALLDALREYQEQHPGFSLEG